MARKVTFTREDVLAAAVAVVEKDMIAQLSARRVAEELGASTAPVYSNFENMDELTEVVKVTIAEDLLEQACARRTGNAFHDMGVGVLEFSRRRPGAYCAIFTHGAASDGVGLYVMRRLLDGMGDVPELAELSVAERSILLRKMAIFTHGLAILICRGLPPDISWDEILTLMAETGEAMVADAFARPPRSAEEAARLGVLREQSALLAAPGWRPNPPVAETDTETESHD